MFGGHSVDLNVEDPKEVDMKFVLPHPGVADWWTHRVLSPINDLPTVDYMNAALDLGAQPGDVARFQVDVTEGSVRFYHGKTDLVAGDCPGGSTVVEAQVSDDGYIKFEVDEPTTVANLFALGYWRP